MVKVVGTVVNDALMLIGFKIAGKHGEIYGGSNTEKIEVRCTLSEAVNRGFKTSKIDFSGGTIKLLGGFKLSELPMEIYLGGTYKGISNEIEATGRITNGKQDVAYRIRLADGTETNLPIANIDKVARIMKPKNFVIRHDESGKAFLAAKSGRIAELPVIANLAEQTAKHTRVTPVQKTKIADITFEDVVAKVAELNGLIAYIPGFVYNRATKATKAENKENETIYGGQLAKAEFVPAVSSANMNLKFRGLRPVEVTLSEGKKTLYCNLYREKSVYRGGKLAMPTIGIVVAKKFAQDIPVIFEEAAPFEITDEKLLEYFSRIIAKTPGQIALFGLKLDGIPAVKANGAIDYKKLAFAVNNYNQVKSALKECNKVKQAFLNSGHAEFSEVHKALQGYSEADLATIAEAGIDIKSFTYTVKEAGEDNDEAEKTAKKDTATEKQYIISWDVELNEAAEAKKIRDVMDLVEEVNGYASNGNGTALLGLTSQLDKSADKLKAYIWEANKMMMDNTTKKIVLPTDANGISMTDATTARMKTSKRAIAEIPDSPITKLTVDIKQAGDFEIVL